MGFFSRWNSESCTAVGFVVSFRRDDFGYISVVAVLPGWRRRGIASRLIAEAAGYLLTLQPYFLQIDVEIDNLAAQKAYEKLGFQVVKTFKD